MANATQYFFLAPTWDYPPPPDGPIKLGNVITSVAKPERPLFTAPEPEPSETISSTKTNVTFSTERLRQRKFGIYTKFLSLLGFGIDASVNFDNNSTTVLGFDVIETAQFFPEKAYLEKCIANPDVKRYLEKSHRRKPVYLVTGLKVVKGAKAKTHQSKGKGGGVKAGIDLTAVSGAPVSVGPEVNVRADDTTDVSFEGSSDFVFAYRLHQIWVQRDMTIKTDDDYKKGAMLGVETRAANGAELTILVDHDNCVEFDGYVNEEILEDGELVICAVPLETLKRIPPSNSPGAE